MENKKRKYDECEGKDLDLNRVFIGLIILLIGFAYLFKALGIISFSFSLFSLWPILIILFGLSLLSKRNIVSNIIAIITILLVLFVIFLMIFYPNINNNLSIKNTPININLEQNILKAKIGLIAGAGEINILGGANQDKIIQGNLLSNIMDLEINSKVVNNNQIVSLEPKDKIGSFKREPKNDLSLRLNTETPLDFTFQGGASNINIDLRSVLAENINIQTGASKLDLKIGNRISSNVKINAGASSINVTLPKDVGVMLTIDSGLSSKTLTNFIVENDRVYKTLDYDSQEKKIEIEISMGIADLNIDWEEMEIPKSKVQLYYYNQLEDKDIECGNKYVLPVEREIELTKTSIQDTINLLIKGEITEEEKEAGFVTEFPNSDFKLLSANLKDGVLSLEFTEVPGFTTGGSCRISILASQIIKTAEQFSGVNEVILLPESIFQP